MFYSRGSMLAAFLVIFLTPFLINTSNNNTCDSYFDYFLINFVETCYHNPDVDLSVPALMEKYTGSAQVYNVTTEDGYVLTMFRIFRSNPVGVILLQPPISGGSTVWLSEGNQSLAVSLWEKGYDVWLSNHRGIPYSRKHVNLTALDPQFWNFSFHEIAIYDLDAQFELIRSATNNSRIIYIGYSLSSTEALIYASLKPEIAENFIKSFILVTPLTSLKHAEGVFKYFLYLLRPFEKFFVLGEFTILEVIRWLARPLTVAPYVINIMTSILMGWTRNGMDPAIYPFYINHHARGISNKVLYHYGQSLLGNGNFSMYDYGELVNKQLYGSNEPPSYPLHRIKSPIYIVSGESDLITTPSDVQNLCDNLLPKGKVYGKYLIPNCNHVDFIFNKPIRREFYQIVFNILDKMENREILQDVDQNNVLR